ncbi:MAG: c-type cytochrome [Bryobacterales bacterium]|nr:c-type cytochrome [Bryobacterales bacterium]
MQRLLVLLLFAAPLAAQNPALREVARDPNEDIYIGKKGHIAAGEQLYSIACSGCHGPGGEGGRGPNLVIGPAAQNKKPTQIYSAIKIGVPGGDMPPFGSMSEEQLWQMTAYVSSLSRPAYEVDVPGDPEAGKALYHGKAGCANCHMIRGEGGSLGPDLSNAGLQNYVLQLREGVLEPNKRITPGFDPVRVVTHSGETIEGVAKNYTNYSMQLLDRSGTLHLLDTGGLKEIVFLKDTWMPANLTDRFSDDEIQNILAFVSRQAARIPAADADTETADN